MEQQQRASDRRPIGEIFVERGYVTEEQLRAALEYQRSMGDQLLGEILVERGIVSRLDLASILSEQWSSRERQMRLVTEGETARVGSARPDAAELRSVVGELREWLAAAREASPPDYEQTVSGLSERLAEQVQGIEARLAEQVRNAIDEHRRDRSEGVDSGALQAELSAFGSRLLDPITRRLDALGEQLSQIGRSAGDFEAHDEIARALVPLGERIDGLELRVSELWSEGKETLHADLAALRHELAARDEWLRDKLQAVYEGEPATDEGDSEDDRAQPAAVDQQAPQETSHVAFARTGTGYDLVERDGAAPPVGEELELAELDGHYVVAAIGCSPFPLDRRRCAYLEPSDAWTSGSRRT
jgi:hypothetical protein